MCLRKVGGIPSGMLAPFFLFYRIDKGGKMNTYQTIRNGIVALGLAVSGSTMASDVDLVDSLTNKVVQYEGVRMREGKVLATDGVARNATIYTVAGLPKLNALSQGLRSLTVDRIVYRDVAPSGPSDGDQLQYTMRTNFADGTSNRTTVTDVRETVGDYTSWSTREGKQRFLQNGVAIPSGNQEVYDENTVIATIILSMDMEEQLRK